MNATPDPSLTVTIVWGSSPDRLDKPCERTFGSDDARAAYFRGIDAARGWKEAYVGNPLSKVPTRVVRWGRGESDVEPEAYVFENEQQAQAFEHGVQDAVGWRCYAHVPSADFRAANGFAEALECTNAVGREALEHYRAQTGGACPEHELIFVRADGAFVGREWAPGGSIENLPLTPAQWRAAFDTALRQGYGAGIDGMGLDDLDLQRWSSGPMARLPAEAAAAFAEHYALDPVASEPVPPARRGPAP